MRRLTILLALGAIATIPSVARADTPYAVFKDVRVAMDDGVLIDSDVYVPTTAPKYTDGLYPCVVELTPYRKESRAAEGASFLPSEGIALIEVDARGTGGSAGEYDIVFSTREQEDAAQMITWAATLATKDGQPLATGGGNKLCETTVGMYGGSYSGIIQYLTASLPLQQGDAGFGVLPPGSPYLTAIAPQRAYGDLYRDIVYHGGIVIGSFGVEWSGGTTAYYTEPPTDMPSADAQAAWKDHLTKNQSIIVNYLENPYSDATFTSNGMSQRLYDDSSVLSRIQNLRVPALHLAGLFDAFTRGQLMTFHEAHALDAPGRGPNFLILGPWNHEGTHFINPDTGFKDKLADWYHYWLQGNGQGATEPDWISNGLDGHGARVEYFQMLSGIADSQTGADGAWQLATDWPPPSVTQAIHFHLRANGVLSTDAPQAGESPSESYVYNPIYGTGEISSRWDNAAGLIPQQQWDQRTENNKGLTYQTDSLLNAIEVDGPIGLHLWAGTFGLNTQQSYTGWPALAQLEPPYQDTDFIVKLSDVAPDGTATLITQGYLRASHVTYDPARSTYLDGELLAPYHNHTEAKLSPPDPYGAPRKYEIEIWPTAKTFGVGHRIRIDIASADTPNHLTLLKPTLNTIFHTTAAGSYLSIPVAN